MYCLVERTFMLFSLTQFIDVRTEVTHPLLFSLRVSFRTSKSFRPPSVSQPNLLDKKITLPATHPFIYAPFTIYRASKLRNCAHRLIFQTTFQTCHIPTTFFSLLIRDSCFFATGFEYLNLPRCALQRFRVICVL